MISAGLTGGIASGKTTTARVFGQMGARRIDADEVAHGVLRRPDIRAQIESRFPGVLDAHGQVDRTRLAPRVFAEPDARAWLNARIHPPVREEIRRTLDRWQADGWDGLVVVEVPLLIESGTPRRYGPVILAWCPAPLQLHRLMARDGLTRDEAELRLAAQLPLDKKRASADYIIDTSSPLDDVRRQAEAIMRALTAAPHG